MFIAPEGGERGVEGLSISNFPREILKNDERKGKYRAVLQRRMIGIISEGLLSC